MKAKWALLAGVCLVCAAGILLGQEKEDRTLLSCEQMTAIINEVSRERALHHVLDPLPLADLMAVLHARETAGSVKLVPKTK